jgi:hypothetical protein
LGVVRSARTPTGGAILECRVGKRRPGQPWGAVDSVCGTTQDAFCFVALALRPAYLGVGSFVDGTAGTGAGAGAGAGAGRV